MVTPDQVQTLLPGRLRHLSDYVTQIANLYVAEDPDGEDLIRDLYIPDAAAATNAPTHAAFRDAFITVCENTGDLPKTVGLRIRAIEIPQLPNAAVRQPRPINYYGRYAADLYRLKKMRVGTRWRRLALAHAAANMEHWFHWVTSGPRVPGRKGQRGELYGPKTSWTKTYDGAGGVEEHDRKTNDFTGWLTGGQPQPDRHSSMNCWEAVLFSAFQADLVDKTWLTTIHSKASLAFEIGDRAGESTAATHYSQALSQAFLFSSSVPYEPRAGLIPLQGDILFFGRDSHVAISLGPTWEEDGQREDWVMSLWIHRDGRFARLTMEELPSPQQENIRYRPCPFPYACQ